MALSDGIYWGFSHFKNYVKGKRKPLRFAIASLFLKYITKSYLWEKKMPDIFKKLGKIWIIIQKFISLIQTNKSNRHWYPSCIQKVSII